MKKQLYFILFPLVLLLSAVCFAAVSGAELISDHFEYTYKNSTIVNNDWTLDTETGLLTIKSVGSPSWNECGTGQSSYDKFGGWSKHKEIIKKVVLDGKFNKISNNAFNGCVNLEEVVITTDIGQIDGSAFYGCSSLHTIRVDKYLRIEGMADLRNVPTLNKNILAGTAIRTLFVSGKSTAEILDGALPESLVEIYGPAGSPLEEYAKAHGIKYSVRASHVNVDVLTEKGIYNSFSIPFGMKLEDYGFSGNGSAICLFENKECTAYYDATQNITDDTTLYAKEILSFSELSVRTSERKSLRAIFEYSEPSLEGSSLEVSQVGAIAGINGYALNDFTHKTEGVTVLTVYKDGEKVGETLGAPKNGTVRFAISAVGFEGTDSEFSKRAMENIVFRGFVTLRDRNTGETLTYYTDTVGSTLAYVSSKILKSDKAMRLTAEEKEFIGESVTLTAGKGDEVRYDKDDLMSLLTDIYNDNGKLLVGEEINPSKTANDVIDSYIAATGEEPSILGMDLACYGAQLMTATKEYRTAFITALIDYCREGGIITASSHFDNPTGNGNICRGYLGEEEMWEELLTDGTSLNRVFKRELNVDAAFLRELGNNDIPILWRPFHEMNGNWFWWCIRQENNYLVKDRSFHLLWEYVYEYYENELGLDNLIWVYSPNNDTGSLADVEYCYPGDEYVDMTGLDWYTSGGFEIDSSENAYFRMMDMRMPVALTEYGSGGKLDSIQTWEDIQKMYAAGMKLTYILTWTSQHTFPNCGKADELMAKPDILSLKDVFALFKAMEGR